jgi:hypothetical protein
MVAVYLGFGAAFLLTDRVLNDEGLVTVVWANALRHAPLAVLFFQKAKPVLSLLYLPAAAFGTRAVLAMHLVVASLSIPLVAATARSLRLPLPNLPPLAVALSPVYFFGGAAGISNVDGVVGTALFLYLLTVRRKEFGAGLVLGALPWVRHELAFLVAVFFLWMALVERRRAPLLGTLVVPVVYTVAGVLYHRDPLWLLHYPPTTLLPMPNNPVWEPVSARQFLINLFSISPVIAICFSARLQRLTPVERTLFAYALGWLVLVTVLPVFRLANFGFSPRYALQVLPAIALLSGRAVEPWLEGERARWFDWLVPLLLFLIWLGTGRDDQLVVVPVLLISAAVVSSAWLRRRRAAVGWAFVLAALGPWLPMRLGIARAEAAPYLPAMANWLRVHPEQARGPVYTNSQLLASYLEGSGHVPGADVRFLMGVDQYFDVVQMSDQHNGQREDLRRAMRLDLYGHGVTPDAVAPESMPEDATFALREDRRLEMLLPAATWTRHLELLESGPGYRIMRLVAPGVQSHSSTTRDGPP